jgi:glyoxylate reductase
MIFGSSRLTLRQINQQNQHISMKPSLYVSRMLPAEVMATIRERFQLTITPTTDLAPSRETLIEGIRDAEAAITTLTDSIDDSVLAAARRVKIIANCAVGYNNIAIDAARARGIIVSNTPDVLTNATADLTWALILATARRMVEGDRLVRSGQWTGWNPTQLLGTDVFGKTLGIIGMGRIGQAVARRAAGFEMPVVYSSRTQRAIPPQAGSTQWRAVSLDELLHAADFISLHVPLTEATRHLIGAAQLQQVKPGAVLINTCRGPVVDEAALVQALQARRLAAAGLDVYEHEPTLHPGLVQLSQVVLLPHLGSATLQTRVQMGMICVQNVDAVLDGRPAPNRVA